MTFYIFKFDYPWGSWHVIKADNKADAIKKALSGSTNIPLNKVKFWKKKGSLPEKLAGRGMLPPGWRVGWE
jgi:hypothetical protein